MTAPTPLIALIGLPNAGKSTLLNKLTGTKKAITAKEAHTTRDLNYAETDWEGYHLRFVDTGGLVPDPEDVIQKEIQIRSGMAIAKADILIWVIDRRQNPDSISDIILQRIWKTGKPFIVCINKVDHPNHDKDISEYARLGGFDFVNVSGVNGYGINTLLDSLVQQSQSMGFEPTVQEMPELPTRQKKKTKVAKAVKQDDEGGYYITRETSEDGPGLYQTIEMGRGVTNQISAVAFDLFGVTVVNRDGEYTLNEQVTELIASLKQRGIASYYLSNCSKEVYSQLENMGVLEKFESGVASFEAGFQKPDLRIYSHFLEVFDFVPEEVVFIDDKESHVQAAREIGMWGIQYVDSVSDLEFELEAIEYGKIDRVLQPPKVLFLGRPNVGKSTLFNALLGEELQIITDKPGTTLSVNDTLVEYEGREYTLLDTAGIRKAGQRDSGVESFATYRTVQAAHEADVIVFVVDASQVLSHQDQVVAGIVQEAKKGVVVIANKADLLAPEDRRHFIKDFHKRFAFLKIESFLWLSAKLALERRLGGEGMQYSDEYGAQKEITNVHGLWKEILVALTQSRKDIDRGEVRKLFNYLMKQKPPNKLRNKKRAIIYDLQYTKSQPPTFELLVKDKSTIHWSYIRFLENIIRRQFRFNATGVKIKVVEADKKRVVS